MYRVVLCVCAMFAACSLADAAQRIVTKEGATYVVPSGSPVKFRSNDEWTTVVFDGQFAARGAYAILYLGDPAQNCEICSAPWSAVFTPDRKLASRLPHWSREPIREIEFENADAFIHAVLTEDMITQLKSGAVSSVSGRATIRVDGFRGQIDCDHAGYTVRFVGVESNTDVRTARTNSPGDQGC